MERPQYPGRDPKSTLTRVTSISRVTEQELPHFPNHKSIIADVDMMGCSRQLPDDRLGISRLMLAEAPNSEQAVSIAEAPVHSLLLPRHRPIPQQLSQPQPLRLPAV
jgi:hypothetical protein